ncbi:MAG: hypothetical protein JWO06_934 [Bacteroidota bacterium]|nr:hypothetical protein [Bacteroidota bacterium]
MAKQIQITIPKPSHENWNEMTPNRQGVYCKACAKNVIDFTTKTENEIYETLVNSNGTTCGRFHLHQIQRPVRKTELNNSLFNWKAIAASLATLISAQQTFADSVSPSDTASAFYQIPSDTTNSSPTNDSIVIEGRVTNASDGTPVINAHISISNSIYKTRADRRGYYKLVIPLAQADSLDHGQEFSRLLLENCLETIEEWKSMRLDVQMDEEVLLSTITVNETTHIVISGGIGYTPLEESNDYPWASQNLKERLRPTLINWWSKFYYYPGLYLSNLYPEKSQSPKPKLPAMEKLSAWISQQRKKIKLLTIKP